MRMQSVATANDPGIRAIKREIRGMRKPLRSATQSIAAALQRPAAVTKPGMTSVPISSARRIVQKTRKRIAQTSPRTPDGQRARRLYLLALTDLDTALGQFAQYSQIRSHDPRPALERCLRHEELAARAGRRAGQLVGERWISE